MPARLQKCVITSYDVVKDKGELLQYAFYADTELVNIIEALKDSKLMQVMAEEMKSIELKKENNANLLGYTDSSWWGNAEDGKSTTGYMFILGGAQVACSSRNESVVALSSRETEYIDVSLCARQATWMVNLIEEIIKKNHGAMTMKIDDMSTINLKESDSMWNK
ncbi:secreted RxLR effector protein 161-like [Lathyrus oleraceus]|uniref:secreted RxLR effector protein 161-like n=1 Tax=Pisum sativum TaxID=3888 RepID=UPI0021D2E018|nr:secreted RxLR effector protein 161-like [Pisum sativum]